MRRKRTTVLGYSGQALVEMAIILPLLLLMVLGIFEFGRALYIKNTLTHAARAGARAAIVTPNIINQSGAICSSSGNNANIYQTVCSNLYSGIKQADVTISVAITDLDSTGSLTPGDMAAVQVTLNNYHANYRIVPFIPLPDTLTGTTAMRYE